MAGILMFVLVFVAVPEVSKSFLFQQLGIGGEGRNRPAILTEPAPRDLQANQASTLVPQ